jgi:hypothetical protein
MTFKNPLGILRFFALMAGMQWMAPAAGAATFHTIPLAWNAVPESGIQGYKVYVGTASRQYTQIYDAGTTPALSVAAMELGKTYYFAVKTIGGTGLESDFSTELVVKIAPPPLPVSGGISTNASGQTGLNWSFPVSALDSSPEFIVEASDNLVTWTQVDTVQPAQSIGGDSQTLRFSWPFAISGPRKFYRMTARNWLGASTGP